MPLQTLLTDSFLTVSYDAANHWLYADWQGEVDLASVRQGQLNISQALHSRPCHKLLNDNSNVIQITDMDTWPITTFTPDSDSPIYLHHIAWILSPRVCYNHRLLAAIQLQPAPVTMCFDDFMAGYEWLRNCASLPPTQVAPQGAADSVY